MASQTSNNASTVSNNTARIRLQKQILENHRKLAHNLRKIGLKNLKNVGSNFNKNQNLYLAIIIGVLRWGCRAVKCYMSVFNDF